MWSKESDGSMWTNTLEEIEEFLSEMQNKGREMRLQDPPTIDKKTNNLDKTMVGQDSLENNSRQQGEGFEMLASGIQNTSRVVTAGDLFFNGISSSGFAMSNLKLTTNVLTAGAVGLTVANGYVDYRRMQNGQISAGEFGYNITGAFSSTVGGTAIGFSHGGFAGAVGGFVIGTYFDVGKILYKGYNQLQHEAGIWKNNLIRSTISSKYYSPF